MQSIELKTSVKTYSMNDDITRIVAFCPTDHNFIKRLAITYDEIEASQTELDRRFLGALPDISAVSEAFIKADTEIRAKINYAFGGHVSETIFGSLPSRALSGGFPLWRNFLLGVFDVCDTEFKAQGGTPNSEIGQLLAKYTGRERGKIK